MGLAGHGHDYTTGCGNETDPKSMCQCSRFGTGPSPFRGIWLTGTLDCHVHRPGQCYDFRSANTKSKHSPNSLFLDREPFRMVRIKEIDALSGLAACIVGIGRLHWVPLFLYSVEGDY